MYSLTHLLLLACTMHGVVQMWVGTSQSNVYKVSVGDLKAELVTTCHYDRINDITYPQ